ncbi:HNH/ENDO VII family nuclease [Aquimarina sp. M1]
MKNYFRQFNYVISILLVVLCFSSCEKEIEERIEVTEISTDKSNIEVSEATSLDLLNTRIFLEGKAKNQIITKRTGSTYLETTYGTVFLDEALRITDGTSDGNLSFKIFPKTFEKGVMYNLVVGPEQSNGERNAFIAKYVRSSSDDTDTSVLEPKQFEGQMYIYDFDASLITSTLSKGSDCPPNDINPGPDGSESDNGSSGGGGGGGSTGGPSGNPSSSGSLCSSYTIMVQCCGPNSTTPHSGSICGCGNGSYYITYVECYGGHDNKSLSKGAGCPDAGPGPILLNEVTEPEHQFTLLELIGDRLTGFEKDWVLTFANSAMTGKILDYIEDNDLSESAKDTALSMIKVLAGTGSVNLFADIEEYKAFMGVISDGIKNRTILYRHPEIGPMESNIDLNGALSHADLSTLSLSDWRFMAQNAIALKHNVENWDGDDSRFREISRSTAAIVLLPQVKSLTQDPSFWPQSPEEWKALGEIMMPFLLEIGLAAIPGSDIVEVVRGIADNDYIAVTLGLAGLTVDAFGGTIVKVVAKFGKAAYKSFKIIRAIGRSLDKVADVIRKGFKFDVENGITVLKKNDEVLERGDEVEEAASKIAAGPGRQFWTSETIFRNIKVYKRDDIINGNLVDLSGRTNKQRMQAGLAPIGPDGKSVNLHHMLQSDSAGIAEMTQTFHQTNHATIHINPNTIPSGIDRNAFNTWKRNYWKERANDF